MNQKKSEVKIVTRNRRAHQRFSVLESYEAGIALQGHEVKSLREGKVSLEEGFVQIENGEIFLLNVHVSPYSHLSHLEYQPTRKRKLLMHSQEIERLFGQVQTKGLTLIPLEIYFKDGKAKLSVGLAKGKKTMDQRETIKKRELEREVRRKFSARLR